MYRAVMVSHYIVQHLLELFSATTRDRPRTRRPENFAGTI